MVNETGSQNETEQSQVTIITDRAEFRMWADEHDAVPVKRPETDRTGLVHGDEVRSDHERRQWSDVLDEFERHDLALVSRESETGRDRYRLVDRSEVSEERGEPVSEIERDLLEGEAVETTVTEREVVETEIVEQATIESELVDSEIVDSEVVETETVDEELIGVAVVETADANVVDEVDRRYFDDDALVEIDESGLVVLEIDERRRETENRLEKKIIESRVVEQDIDEETRVEDESLDIDVDAAGIHEQIARSGLVAGDTVVDERHVDTEFDEAGAATSTLTERKTLDREIEERKVLFAEVTEVDVDDSRIVGETVVGSEIVDSDVNAVADLHSESETTRQRRTEERAAASTESEETTTETDEREVGEGRRVEAGQEITENLMGRTVEIASGEKIGMVSDVDENDGVVYVDEDPSTTDKIKAHLHWGDDDASALTADQIREIRSDAVVVKGHDV
jgi:hypothetical protein